MKNLILVAFLALAAAAWLHHGKSPLQAEDLETPGGVWVLDDFRSQVNQVNRFTIHKGDDTWHLQRLESGWVSVDQANYPLEFQKVREFLFGLIGLQNPQAKTFQPKRWVDLQLDPQAEPKPTGRVQAWVDDAAVLDLWVGKSRWQPDAGVYLRHEGEDQTWLAKGRLEFPWQLSSWMDTQVISLSAADVLTIAIDGDLELTLHKGLAENDKSGNENDKAFSNLSSALSFLSFESAMALDHEAFGQPAFRTLTWTTTDGGKIQMDFFPHLEGHAAKLTLTPSVILVPTPAQEEDDPEGEVASDESVGEATPEPQVEADPRWQTWGFTLSTFSADKLLEGPEDWQTPEEG